MSNDAQSNRDRFPGWAEVIADYKSTFGDAAKTLFVRNKLTDDSVGTKIEGTEVVVAPGRPIKKHEVEAVYTAWRKAHRRR